MAARNVPNALKTINATLLQQQEFVRLPPQLCPEVQGDVVIMHSIH